MYSFALIFDAIKLSSPAPSLSASARMSDRHINNRQKNYEKFVKSRAIMMTGPKIWSVISGSLYPAFVIQREFVRRIQGTRHLVRYTGTFVIPGVR